MENILKLTVKKDVFDKLSSGEQKYIYLDANGYWIRRLAVNSTDEFDKLKKTQEFRTFDGVEVTCAKESATYGFKVIKTGYEDMSQDGVDTGIVVWLDIEDDNEAPDEYSIEEYDSDCSYNEGYDDVPTQDDDDDDCEDEGEDEEMKLTTDLSEVDLDKDEPYKPNIDTDVLDVVDKTISDIIDIIGEYDNVVLVNTPAVIITSSGRIFGSKNRININNDQEIRFGIGTEKVIYDTKTDEQFVSKVEKYLCGLAKTNYLFIWKEGCKVIKDNESIKYLKLRMSIKRFL